MDPASPSTPLLSVVVPTRNEAENVEVLVARLASVLDGVPTQLVFVDDSSDRTTELLAALAATPPPGISMLVLHREPARQTGLGSAAALGIRRATGSVVAVMDGDLQHPPELLRSMVRRLEEDGLDVVVASRYTRGGSARGLNGPARVVVSWGSKVVAQLLFREARKTSDPLSGYFICRRTAVEGLEFRPIGFKILLEVLVCAASARVGDVPLTFAERHAGRSNASVAQGVAFLRHLASLLLHVPGSARVWKYATVGAAGLAIFLAILAASTAMGSPPLPAWALAFLVSLFLNWQLNRVVTFADIASPFTAGAGRAVYLPVALGGGLANLAVFVVAVYGLRWPALAAGLAGALAAMAVNFSVQRRVLRRPPRLEPGPGSPQHAIVERVARVVSATVHLLLAPVGALDLDGLDVGDGGPPPRELLRAVSTARPLMLAEAPSATPQARTDIGVNAWMAVPLVEGTDVAGLLVLQRQGRPFGGDELRAVLRSLRSAPRSPSPGISPLLAADKSPN